MECFRFDPSCSTTLSECSAAPFQLNWCSNLTQFSPVSHSLSYQTWSQIPSQCYDLHCKELNSPVLSVSSHPCCWKSALERSGCMQQWQRFSPGETLVTLEMKKMSERTSSVLNFSPSSMLWPESLGKNFPPCLFGYKMMARSWPQLVPPGLKV